MRQRCSARFKRRGSRSEKLCGAATRGHGRADQAFELVESDLVDRATANSSPWITTGHKQLAIEEVVGMPR